MTSPKPSDTGLERIIHKLDDLQLPESSKRYFTELLKHIDARDQEWTKVVKKWEHYEGHSKSFNREMIEIMRNVQDLFLKDDVFLKQLYKGRMEEVGATLKDDSA